MDAGVDAAVAHLLRRRGEAGVRARHARQAVGAQREGDGVGAEEGRQHRRGRGAVAAVARDVRGVGGRPQERRPGRVGRRVGVAVGVGGADGGHRPPEVVGVLGVPDGEVGVRLGQVEQGEQPGVLHQRVAALLRRPPGRSGSSSRPP